MYYPQGILLSSKNNMLQLHIFLPDCLSAGIFDLFSSIPRWTPHYLYDYVAEIIFKEVLFRRIFPKS